MKHLKFSRLFAAVTFVAILALAGCKQPEEETPYAIEGTWLDATYGQKFEITHSELKNFYNDYLTGEPKEGYAGNELTVEQSSDTSGMIYIKYTKAGKPDWSGYSSDPSEAPDVGKWYAVSYKDLTDTTVKISASSNYYNSGVSSCDSLEEAKAEFTVDKGYFVTYDDFVKQ
jgi:hypothetical protein